MEKETKVIIKCPECERKQRAIIEHTVPWPTFIHVCMFCEYLIMESEWNQVKESIIDTHYGR